MVRGLKEGCAMTIFAHIDELSIDTLGLPTITTNSLRCCGNIETVGELRRKTLKELSSLPYIGKKGLRAIQEVLQKFPPP